MSSSSSSSSSGPNCVTPIVDYVNKILNNITGMKALILDEETSGIIGLAVPLSDLLAREVYFVDRLDSEKAENSFSSSSSSSNSREQLHHLKAVVYIRPTTKSVERLKRLIRTNTYKEFHIFFSNFVSDDSLRSLSEVDDGGYVHEVNEYYGDYYALSSGVFSLSMKSSSPLFAPPSHWVSGERQLFDRNVTGLLSLMLAQKRKCDLRYSEGSEIVKMCAHEINRRINEEQDLFTFNQKDDTPLLLILDRRDDPVTPLLHQWTYRSMVHNIFNIHNNRVQFKQDDETKNNNNNNNKSKDKTDKEVEAESAKEVVLSIEHDDFYERSFNLNFGDLGASIKQLVADYQKKTKTTTKLESIEDMQRFVDNYPQFRAQATQVSKHVALVTELSKMVDRRQLMSVSEVEQELACVDDHSSAVEKVERLLHNPRVDFNDKLHVVMLYALRYENERHEIPKLKKVLRDQAQNNALFLRRCDAVDAILKIAGVNQRAGDLYGNKNLLGRATALFSSGLRGVENIYTQHRPLLFETLNNLLSGKLKNTSFPFVDAGNYKAKYRSIFVYMIGGATYEEASFVHTLNEQNAGQGLKIVLGGSTIHNSISFVDDILNIDENERAALLSRSRDHSRSIDMPNRT